MRQHISLAVAASCLHGNIHRYGRMLAQQSNSLSPGFQVKLERSRDEKMLEEGVLSANAGSRILQTSELQT